MELDDVINRRRTIRKYIPYKMPQEDLDIILRAACKGPSAGNLQSYHVIAVTNSDVMRRMAIAANDQEFIQEASASLVFCAAPENSAQEYGNRGKDLYCIQDASISALLAILKAVDLGYSTAWIGSFDEEELAGVLGIEGIRPVAIIPVGKGDENPSRKSGRKFEDMVSYLG